MKIPSSEKSLIDLATNIYEENDIIEISKFNGSLNELDMRYPIECIREKMNNYRISYLGDGNIVVLLFDNYGHKQSGKVYSVNLLKSDFYGLTKGQSIEDVKKIDPEGEYLFLYTGRNDVPKVSQHYTKDGYLITIEYDELNTIVRVNEELI